MQAPTGPGERVAQLIDGFLPESATVMNVGSGDGGLSHALRARGHTVMDLDVANGVIRPELPEPVLFDGQQIPVPTATVDVVLCVYVLHHAHTGQRVLLDEMARVSRERVIVLEDTPRRGYEHVLLFVHALLSYLRSWSRWCTFRTDPEWRALFRSHQLAVEASGRVPGRRYFPVTHTYYVLQSASADSVVEKRKHRH